MKFSNTIKTVLKIYQKYVKNSVWFGTGIVSHFNQQIQKHVTGILSFPIRIFNSKELLSLSK